MTFDKTLLTFRQRCRGIARPLLGASLVVAFLGQACEPYVTCEQVPACANATGGSGEGGDGPSGGSQNSSGGAPSGGSKGSGGSKSSGGKSGSGGKASGGSGSPGSGGEDSLGGATGGGESAAGGDASTGGSASQGDPASCELDEDCPVSGLCRLSFRDEDGDGYGSSTESTGRCDGSIPSGYSGFDTDCCDDGGNLALAAQINPGQEGYFDVPANICGIDWDYDCSGKVNFGGYVCTSCNDASKRSPTNSSTRDSGCALDGVAQCEDSSSCRSVEVPLLVSDCGTSVAVSTCYCAESGCIPVGVAGRFVNCH